jgi:hypothetical protein
MEVEKFLAKYLGGRFQETGSPECVKRLKEITIDPKTVTITGQLDPLELGSTAPQESKV